MVEREERLELRDSNLAFNSAFSLVRASLASNKASGDKKKLILF